MQVFMRFLKFAIFFIKMLLRFFEFQNILQKKNLRNFGKRFLFVALVFIDMPTTKKRQISEKILYIV